MKFKKEKLYFFLGLVAVSMLNPSYQHTHQGSRQDYFQYMKNPTSHK